MKVAFISTPNFADCDIPLINALQKKVDLYYFLKVSESSKRQTLIKINTIKRKGGVFHSSDFPELAYLSEDIDMSKTYIVNLPGKHDWSLCNLLAIFRMVCFILRLKINNRIAVLYLRFGP